MKKFMFICIGLVLSAITSVTFGADNPSKEKYSFNHECNVVQSNDVVVNAYFLDVEGYLNSKFIYSSGYSISKNKSELNINLAILSEPPTIHRQDTKFKVNDPINYNEPFVDKSYVWKYSHNFNC